MKRVHVERNLVREAGAGVALVTWNTTEAVRQIGFEENDLATNHMGALIQTAGAVNHVSLYGNDMNHTQQGINVTANAPTQVDLVENVIHHSVEGVHVSGENTSIVAHFNEFEANEAFGIHASERADPIDARDN